MREVRQIGSVAKFSDFSIINSNFTRARCRVMYAGRNRNRNDITENAVNKLISRRGYANVPVVAHLYKDEDGKWRVGGHDSKIVINADGGIEVINETVPFGVIPEDCNPAFEDVTETTGEVKRYFCVDVVLWTHRYNIMDAVKSDELWFNQSMEIYLNQFEYDNDGYCVIDDFDLSALCLLNHDPYNKENEVRPCFPSSSVTKFELEDFRKEFEILLDEYKKLSYKKEENKVDISQIRSKIDSKYFVLSCTSDAVTVMQKEDFELYEIPFKVDSDNIVFSYDKAVKKFMSVSDKDSGFSFAAVKDYVEEVKNEVAKGAEKTYAEKFEAEKVEIVNELTNKFNELSANYEAAQTELGAAKKTIEAYKTAEKKAETDKHKAEIDDVIKSYSAQLETNADFLLYRTKVDYSKTREQIEQDMLVILGKQAARNTANFSANYSANWGARNNVPTEGKANGRYGDLFSDFED